MKREELVTWLESYRNIYHTCEYLESKSDVHSVQYDKVPAKGRTKDIIWLNDMERLKEERERLHDIAEAIKLIDTHSIYYTILLYKYVGYYDRYEEDVVWLTLEQIAEMLALSLRHVQRLHKQALKLLLDKLNEKNESDEGTGKEV